MAKVPISKQKREAKGPHREVRVLFQESERSEEREEVTPKNKKKSVSKTGKTASSDTSDGESEIEILRPPPVKPKSKSRPSSGKSPEPEPDTKKVTEPVFKTNPKTNKDFKEYCIQFKTIKAANKKSQETVNELVSDDGLSKTQKNLKKKMITALNERMLFLAKYEGQKRKSPETETDTEIALKSLNAQLEAFKLERDKDREQIKLLKLTQMITESDDKKKDKKKTGVWDRSDNNPDFKGLIFKDDSSMQIGDFIKKFKLITKLTNPARKQYLLIKQCEVGTVQDRLIQAIKVGDGKKSLTLTGAYKWLQTTYVQEDYPFRLTEQFYKLKQASTVEIPQFARQFRDHLVRLKKLGRGFENWQVKDYFMQAIKEPIRIKVRHNDGKSYSDMTIKEIVIKATAIEKKLKEKTKGKLAAATLELNVAESNLGNKKQKYSKAERKRRAKTKRIRPTKSRGKLL